MSPVPQTESRRRKSGIWLPEEPSEEELARHWTLSEADRREVSQCRGDENRRRFGMQLCVLRNYGRLLESGESGPIRIVNHLGAQLQLPPVLFAAGATRPATETEYTDRIRRYLGYQSFGSKVQRELAVWAKQRTLEGLALAEVALRAEELLHSWLVVLPRVAVFERLAAVPLPSRGAAGVQQNRGATAAVFPGRNRRSIGRAGVGTPVQSIPLERVSTGGETGNHPGVLGKL